jgi:hypothetical protein
MRTEEVHSSPRKDSRLGSHRVVLSPQATPVPASASKLNVDITITQERKNATTQQSFGPEPGTKQSLIRISSTRNDDFPQHGGASVVCCSFWPLPLCGAPEIQSPAWTTNVAIARILGSGENRRLFSGHGSPFFAWKRPRGLPVRCKPDLCIGDDFFPLQSSISAPQVQVGVYCCSCHASRSYCFRGHVPRSSSASHKIETIFLGTWPGKIMDGLFRARMSVLSYRSAR